VTEPQRALVDAAVDVLGAAAQSLRERGWPVELRVDHVPERFTYAVSLRFELPQVAIPSEYEHEREHVPTPDPLGGPPVPPKGFGEIVSMAGDGVG
jgi:hypothetical protein